MIRRILATVALVVCAGYYALALERATFILTDGERKSGTVVFHTPARENLINGYLNLGTDAGTDLTFPVDQVACIDFVGGRPAVSELDALPSTPGTHLIALRNGYSEQGQLINLIGGDTVRWRNGSGQEQQYAIRDVKRIYLNAESARTAFSYGRANRNAVATSGQTLEPGAIRVDARQPWTDTGIDVRKDDRVSFRVSGQIQWAAGSDAVAGPDGNGSVRRPDYPLPSAPVGAFIGRINNGPAFGIGTQSQPLPMPSSGRLWVGINDQEFGDNGGFYSVVVTRQPR